MPFDFDAAVSAPFRMQPGLRRIAPGAPQLTPNVAPQRGAARHLREKLAVFQAFLEQALLVQEGFDAHPIVNALAQHAAHEQPQAFGVEGERFVARALGWAVDHAARVHDVHAGLNAWPEVGYCLAQAPAEWRHALLLALSFAEDFAVIDARDTTIPWLAVALPSHWAPEHKVGRPFAEVHAPVADNRLITGAAQHLARLVTGDGPWERFVWTITRHPRLHAHPARVSTDPWPAHLDGDALAACAWWRTEHQTFIAVPALQQAVFTIHVETQPLALALSDATRAARVHDALASMSEAVLAYRGLSAVRERLLRWLGSRAQQ